MRASRDGNSDSLCAIFKELSSRGGLGLVRATGREACAARNNLGRCSGSSLRTLSETARRNGQLPQNSGSVPSLAWAVVHFGGSTTHSGRETRAGLRRSGLSRARERVRERRWQGFTGVILTERRRDVNPPFHGICSFFVDCGQPSADCANCSCASGKTVTAGGENYTTRREVRLLKTVPGAAGIGVEWTGELSRVTTITAYRRRL